MQEPNHDIFNEYFKVSLNKFKSELFKKLEESFSNFENCKFSYNMCILY